MRQRVALLACLTALLLPARFFAADPILPGFLPPSPKLFLPLPEEPSELYLIPRPKAVQVHRGYFRLESGMRLLLPPDLPRPERLAIQTLQFEARALWGIDLQLDLPGFHPVRELAVSFSVVPDEVRRAYESTSPEAYRIVISSRGVQVEGLTHAGLFQGVQRLRWILRHFGPELPYVVIEDFPSFERRAVMLDVSRGRVPTLAYLMEFVELCSLVGITEFHLYIEHPFAWRFAPEIAGNEDAFRPQDILELDAFCADRRIELVPNIQTLGHMGRILSLEPYRELAAVPPPSDRPWEEWPWGERVRGLTLNPVHPKAQGLVEQIVDHYVPLHSSRRMHVGLDEPFDLLALVEGGASDEPAAEDAATTPTLRSLYLGHLRFVHELGATYGRSVMVWGDILRKHPEWLPEVPRDVTVVHWGYWAETDVEFPAVLQQAGLPFMVCPGTSSWNRFIPAFSNADENIRRMAAAGAANGALGLMLADWGDDGHVQPPALTLHGLLLGAEAAWNPAEPMSVEEFDAAWSVIFLRDTDARLLAALRQLDLGDQLEAWRHFHRRDFHGQPAGADPAPLSDWRIQAQNAQTKERLEAMPAQILAALRLVDDHHRADSGAPVLLEEIRIMVELQELFAEKILIERAMQGVAPEPGSVEGRALARRLDVFSDHLAALRPDYESVWLARSAPKGVIQVLEVFRRVEADARRLSLQLDPPSRR